MLPIRTYLEFVKEDEVELLDESELLPEDVLLVVGAEAEGCVVCDEVVELKHDRVSLVEVAWNTGIILRT